MAYQVQTETKPAMYSGTAAPITSAGSGANVAPTVTASQQTKSSGDFVAPIVGAGLGALAQSVLGANPLGQLASDPTGTLAKLFGKTASSGPNSGTPATQTPQTYYQDASGNIYTPDGYLYAANANGTYYVANSDGTWTNANTGTNMTYAQMYQEITGTQMPSGEYVQDYQLGDLYYPYGPNYDPYANFTPSDTTTYYTPIDTTVGPSYGTVDNTNTSYWTPIDTSIGPTWKEGGSVMNTPLYASGGEVKADGVHMAGGGFLDSLLSSLSSGGVQGALVGTLLSQLLSSSSTGGGGATPVDMSKVGAIAPRTTSFGMGHPNYVTYGEYGQPPGDAGTQYNQLFGDLGVSGYAPRLSPLAYSGKNPLGFADGGNVEGYYTFGEVVRPEDNLADGGTPAIPESQLKYMRGSPSFGAPVSSSRKTTSTSPAPAYFTPNSMFGAAGSGHPAFVDQQGLKSSIALPAGKRPTGLVRVGGSLIPMAALYGYNFADGGRSMNFNVPSPLGQTENANVPMLEGRKDYRQGSYVEGAGDGQSDDIPAMLADGEYVMDAEVVSALGNGSNKAGAKVLDKMRENIRKHKRSGALDSIPPKAKSPLAYMKGAK